MKENFIEAFFDYIVPEIQITSKADLAAKKDNIRYTDTFKIFKIEKSVENATSQNN